MKLRIIQKGNNFYLQERVGFFTWKYCKNFILIQQESFRGYWETNRHIDTIDYCCPVHSIEEAIEWATIWKEKFEEPKKRKS